MTSQVSLDFGRSAFRSAQTGLDEMAQQTSTNNAIGTLIGYIGAEAATQEIFERLLWPQRFYSSFNLKNVVKMALFLPMGAPLHKAALAALDQIRKNGLFKGPEQGHMLGSPFYRDENKEYSSHSFSNPGKPENELVRNGIWIRAIANLPIPVTSPLTGSRSVETGLRETGAPGHQRIRAVNRVSYLRLSIPRNLPPTEEIIGGETGSTTLKTYLALLVTEITAVVTGIVVAVLWRSFFMVLWFIPLFLKLASAYLAVSRGPLTIPSEPRPSRTPTLSQESSPLAEKPTTTHLASRKFEIHDPLNGFVIIEGNEDLVLQFFRHYGHPIRNRFRECAQIFIVAAFGFLFPVGLVCSILWMPVSIQYVWLGYQLYATLAMYVYHYSEGHTWGTTEQRIAQKFGEQAAKGHKQKVYFGGDAGVLMAELEITYHSRVREGKVHMERLLSGEV